MKPKRVLICGFTGNYGGMEAYIMNIYRNIDRTKLQFDFLYPYEDKMAFSDEVLKLGGHIYHVPGRKKSLIKHYILLRRLFKDNDFEGIYYQCTRKLRTMQVFKYAKKYKVKYRVIHSHSSNSINTSCIDKIRVKFVEKQYKKYITDFFACSENAGKWMFGDRNYSVINNGINTNLFKFNKDSRNLIRKKERIPEDAIVLGTVGRLSQEKNPMFFIPLFIKYLEKHPNSYFLHVGGGEQLEKLEKKIKEFDLQEHFILKGKQENVYDYMNAMDVFLLPSLYEGFPIVLVEAQSTGLMCISSSNVTESSNILGLVRYCSIDRINDWLETLENELIDNINNRHDRSEDIEKCGYGIKQLAERIQEFFLN